MVARLKFEIDDKTSEGFAKIQKAAAEAARSTAISTEKAAKQAEKASRDAASAAKAAWKDFADSGTKYGSDFHVAYVKANKQATDALKGATDARVKATSAAESERNAVKGLSDQIASEAQRFRELSSASARANREVEAMRGALASASSPAERLKAATDLNSSLTSLKQYNSELAKMGAGGAGGAPGGMFGPRGGSLGGAAGDAGSGGKFSTMANRVNALNLVRGHEMQLRGVAGILDALGPTGVKLAGIGAGAGAAALAIYGTVKSLDILGRHGSKSAQSLSDSIKGIPSQFMKITEAAEEFLGKRAARAFDSLVTAARETGEGTGLLRPQSTELKMLNQTRGSYAYRDQLLLEENAKRNKGEDRDLAVRRNLFEGRVSSSSMDARHRERAINLRNGIEFDPTQSTDQRYLQNLAKSQRVRNDQALTGEAPQMVAQQEVIADMTAKMESLKKEREAALAVEAKTSDEKSRQQALIRDRIKQEQAADAKKRDAELELLRITEARKARMEEINAIEARAVELDKQRIAREAARKDRTGELDILGQRHAEDMGETRTGMNSASRADSLDKRAAKLREQADYERQQLEIAKGMHLDTQASREAFATKIGRLEAEAAKIEGQRHKEQKDGIKDQAERHRLDLERTKELIKQQEAAQDAADTEEKRERITKELNRTYQKELELIGKIHNREKELLSLEEQRTREVEARGEAEQRVADEVARRDKERAENKARERTQALVGGIVQGALSGPLMGLDQNALNTKAAAGMADQNAKNAAAAAGRAFDAQGRRRRQRGGANPQGDDLQKLEARKKTAMDRAARAARAATWRNAKKAGFVTGGARDAARQGGGRLAGMRAAALAARQGKLGALPGNSPTAMAQAQGAAMQNVMGALTAGSQLGGDAVALMQNMAQLAAQEIQDKATLRAEVARIDAMVKALMNGGNGGKNAGRGMGLN